MVPQDGRHQLAGNHGHQVALHGGPAQRGEDHGKANEHHYRRLQSRGDTRRQAQQVGHGTRREVVRRRDRIAELADQDQEIRPRARTDDQRDEGRGNRDRGEPDPERAPAASERRPDEHDAGLQFDQRPGGSRDPEWGRPIQPPPADREGQEQQGGDLAKLQRVDERIVEPGQEDDPPADIAPDGQDGNANEEGCDEQRDPGPDRGTRRQQRGKWQHGQDERRRVEEQPEHAGDGEARVVQRLAGQEPSGRRVVRLVVVAQVAGSGARGHDREDRQNEDRQSHDRQRGRQQGVAANRMCPRAPCLPTVRGERRAGAATGS